MGAIAGIYQLTGDTGAFKRCTRWIEGVPRFELGWLGEYLDVTQSPKQFILGFSCSQCGFVELYTVTEADLEFHARSHYNTHGDGA